jgi:small GTP-binding protein
MSAPRPCEAKVVFLGDSAVGKTSIISAYAHEEYSEEHSPTVGAHFSLQRLQIGTSEVKLKIWDTAGQERFRALTPMYYRDSQVAVLVFALDSQESLDGLSSWIENLRRDTRLMPEVVVVGNKSDLERRVQGAEQFADRENAVYVECSAKERKGIDELFTIVAQKALTAQGSGAVDSKMVQEITAPGKKKGCC